LFYKDELDVAGNHGLRRADLVFAKRFRLLHRLFRDGEQFGRALGVFRIDGDAETQGRLQNQVSVGDLKVFDFVADLLGALLGSNLVGAWEQNVAKPVRRLNGQTMGLCGFGKIPRQLAKRAAAFDMKLIAYDPYVDAGTMDAAGVRKVSFDELCSESDVISITLPLTDETRWLFDEKAFAAMKPDAFIINTARGAVIKESALIEALRTGQIAGAGLDVVENENLPLDRILPADHPLNHFDNVIITPHSGWMSEDSERSLLLQCAAQVHELYRNGKPAYSLNFK